MSIKPSIKREGIYNYETMDIPNIINLVEESDLDKLVVFNITYQLLGSSSDRISLEVQKENVSDLDCEVISYKLDLDGTTSLIYYLIGEEVKFLFVSKIFNKIPSDVEEGFLREHNYAI